MASDLKPGMRVKRTRGGSPGRSNTGEVYCIYENGSVCVLFDDADGWGEVCHPDSLVIIDPAPTAPEFCGILLKGEPGTIARCTLDAGHAGLHGHAWELRDEGGPERRAHDSLRGSVLTLAALAAPPAPADAIERTPEIGDAVAASACSSDCRAGSTSATAAASAIAARKTRWTVTDLKPGMRVHWHDNDEDTGVVLDAVTVQFDCEGEPTVFTRDEAAADLVPIDPAPAPPAPGGIELWRRDGRCYATIDGVPHRLVPETPDSVPVTFTREEAIAVLRDLNVCVDLGAGDSAFSKLVKALGGPEVMEAALKGRE